MKERAIAVTILLDQEKNESDPKDLSEELQALVEASGLEVAESMIYKEKTPNAPHLIGMGKLEELARIGKKEKANVFVVSHDLSATQQKNLEEILGQKTIDRTQLILDIFAQRARSNEGKLQVELAQLKYLLPRLAGQGIYLSRLGGGIGTRGPGEQKLEVDRRRAREKVVKLSRELATLQKRRAQALDRKKEKDFSVIALVGYTNAGKSRLFNALTDSKVMVKNQLFSTLDTTTRLAELPHNQKALIVDTVGFVRDLPHHLVESFKATLEEALHADILIHVMDYSREDRDVLEKAVESVLKSLGAQEKKALRVFNKLDLVSDFKERGAFGISALTGQGVPELKALLSRELMTGFEETQFFIPKERHDLLPFLYEQSHVIRRQDTDRGVEITTHISPKSAQIFRSKLR